ncbi:hypothetical protein J4461_04340 [Candidatus Pacearchaeota archaeon]|nr:hypothetical protein [Candidatus Pacearchaeota archaeon]
MENIENPWNKRGGNKSGEASPENQSGTQKDRLDEEEKNAKTNENS